MGRADSIMLQQVKVSGVLIDRRSAEPVIGLPSGEGAQVE